MPFGMGFLFAKKRPLPGLGRRVTGLIVNLNKFDRIEIADEQIVRFDLIEQNVICTDGEQRSGSVLHGGGAD